jgi:hypothetical protein
MEKIKNGAFYFNENTPNSVMDILNDAYNSGKRIRVFYGDRNTGEDWCEVYDTIGYVGKSTGIRPSPLLIKTSRSIGGGAFLTDCIVKITIDKKVVYQQENYFLPLELKDGRLHHTINSEWEYYSNMDDDFHKRMFDFFSGVRNN